MRGSIPPVPAGYELVRPIGHGASSVVWQATQLSTGRPVALKILDADVSDPDAARRFEREREVMAALAVHPGIVTIHDAGVQEGRPWIALELCRRGSLASHVAGTGPMPAATVLAVLVRLADALAAAHARGVLHCDVKPANVMLTDHGEPALGDFGIARVTVGRATTTTVGGFSLDHVAPELLDEEKSSPRSDVYSLGTTAWELLAGEPPFRRAGDVSVGTVLKRIMTQPLPDLPEVPVPVLDLLREMTAKDPAARTGTMADVAQRTRELARELGLPLHTDLALPPLAALADETTDGPAVDVGPDGSKPPGDATVHRRRPVAPPPPGPTDAPAARPRQRGVLVAAVAAVLALAVGTGVLVARPWAAPDAEPQPRVDVLAQTSAPDTGEPAASVSPSVSPSIAVAAPSPVPARSEAREPARVTTRHTPVTTPARERRADPAAPAGPAAPAAAPEADSRSAGNAGGGDSGGDSAAAEEVDDDTPAPKAPVRKADGSACFATAIRGGLTLGDNQQRNAGGPNFTSSACNAIHVKLTAATYRTYARSCLENASGSGITSCSGWKLLSYPDTWDTLSTNVPAGTRWQIQMYGLGPQRVSFSYTA